MVRSACHAGANEAIVGTYYVDGAGRHTLVDDPWSCLSARLSEPQHIVTGYGLGERIDGLLQRTEVAVFACPYV